MQDALQDKQRKEVPKHSNEKDQNEKDQTKFNDQSELDIDALKMVLRGLDFYTLTGIIKYANEVLTDLKRVEVGKILADIEVFKVRLKSLGPVGNIDIDGGFINPKNPKEVYIRGRYPQWLTDLVKETGKTLDELKNS